MPFFFPPTNEGLTNPNWLVLKMKVIENTYESWLLWLFLQKNLTGEIYFKTQAFVFILSFFRCSLFQGSTWLVTFRQTVHVHCQCPQRNGDEGCAWLPGVQTSLVSSHPWLSVPQTAFPLELPLSGLAAEGSSGGGSCARSSGQRVFRRTG